MQRDLRNTATCKLMYPQAWDWARASLHLHYSTFVKLKSLWEWFGISGTGSSCSFFHSAPHTPQAHHS